MVCSDNLEYLNNLEHSQILDGLLRSDTLEWFGILTDTLGVSDTHIARMISDSQKLLNGLGYLQTLSDTRRFWMVLDGLGWSFLVVVLSLSQLIQITLEHPNL